MRSLRKQLRDTYESLLFLDAAFAAANDVDGQMWRTVFYLPIEEFRSRIRKAEKEAQQQQKAGPGPAAAAVVSDTKWRALRAGALSGVHWQHADARCSGRR